MTKNLRLFDYFKPNVYKLTLDINETDLAFTGHVIITGQLTGNSLFLHAKDLIITDVAVNGQAGSAGEANEHHEVEITSEGIRAGDATVELSFSGTITGNMTGIYPSRFHDNGTDKIIIATQFEAPHAREAFPCIDEPSAKAVFELTLTSDKNNTHLSNTLALSEQIDSNRKITQFKPTPKMSTYLLGFVSGELHAKEGTTKNNTLVRCFSSVAQPLDNLEYALSESIAVLEFFEHYFKTPYPLEKCDHIALPDFDAGAMENWGMITYREVALLTDAKNRSVSGEQHVSLVIAHEVSHQWFGNLVTMAWWDDLWLNESFASLMEHIALDALHPDWQQWEMYASMDVISTTSRDIFKDIQPVVVDIDDPNLLETLFDPGIVYAKGGRLLKMLREMLGEKAFVDGLKTYFADNAYGNASRDELWRCLEKSSKVDVKALLDPWLVKPGMPLLNVRATEQAVIVSQKRFLLDGDDSESLWPVPLLGDGLSQKAVLDTSQESFESLLPYPVLNAHASGHYITHYATAAHQAKIAQVIQSNSIAPEARINIINDMILLSRGGHASLVDALNVVSSMQHEARFSVWTIMARVFNTAAQLTEGDKAARDAIASVRINLANEQYTKLGWEDHERDDVNTIQLRSLAIAFMLAGEDEDALSIARKLLNSAGDPANLPSELRAIVLSALIRKGDNELAMRLLTDYDKSDPEMQIDITSALSSTKDVPLAKDILEKSVQAGGFVRAQDLARWISFFLRNFETRDLLWELLRNDWQYFETKLQESKSFDFIPIICANVVNTQDKADEYREFFEPKLVQPVLKRNISIGLADIGARVAWRKREEAEIKRWLADAAK